MAAHPSVALAVYYRWLVIVSVLFVRPVVDDAFDGNRCVPEGETVPSNPSTFAVMRSILS